MKTFLVAIFCLGIYPAFAQQQIKVEDAKSHIGDSVKICSKIYGTKYFSSGKDPVTLLDVGAKYPDTFLTIMIPDDARKLFKKPPEEYYKGASVCVTGTIQLFKGKPEIIVRNPAQIQDIVMDELLKNEPK